MERPLSKCAANFARLKDDHTLVVMCPLDEKEMLMEVDPKVYFETDHYKGWPAVLVRLKAISAPKLRHRLEQAWRLKGAQAAPRSARRPAVVVGWVKRSADPTLA